MDVCICYSDSLQALDVIKQFTDKEVIQIQRAYMRLRLSIPGERVALDTEGLHETETLNTR